MLLRLGARRPRVCWPNVLVAFRNRKRRSSYELAWPMWPGCKFIVLSLANVVCELAFEGLRCTHDDSSLLVVRALIYSILFVRDCPVVAIATQS